MDRRARLVAATACLAVIASLSVVQPAEACEHTGMAWKEATRGKDRVQAVLRVTEVEDLSETTETVHGDARLVTPLLRVKGVASGDQTIEFFARAISRQKLFSRGRRVPLGVNSTGQTEPLLRRKVEVEVILERRKDQWFLLAARPSGKT